MTHQLMVALAAGSALLLSSARSTPAHQETHTTPRALVAESLNDSVEVHVSPREFKRNTMVRVAIATSDSATPMRVIEQFTPVVVRVRRGAAISVLAQELSGRGVIVVELVDPATEDHRGRPTSLVSATGHAVVLGESLMDDRPRFARVLH